MNTKILIVEDEGITAMGIQRKLKSWGYEAPVFAFSKKEALKKTEELQPDLILMDIVLKGEGDGIDAVKEIQNRFDVPIIYITAYSDEKTMKRANDTNYSGYITKPFEFDHLHRSIEAVFKKISIEKNLVNNGKSLDEKLKDSDKAVIVTDANGCIKFMNKSAEMYTGYTQSDNYPNDLLKVFNIKKGENQTGENRWMRL